jgi:DNA-binding NarL/FixJ family response regulator
MRLPDMSGADVIRRIRLECPSAAILVLTNYKGDAEIRRALGAGAAGYLFKTSARQDLVAAIRTVSTGGQYISKAVRTSLATGVQERDLTQRETEVLGLMGTGCRNKEIACELGISEPTVKEHVSNLFLKLGVADRTAAISLALKRGLIQVD